MIPIRDDTRASDDHNYTPTQEEWQAFYADARSCGASARDATDFADDMIEGRSIYMQSC